MITLYALMVFAAMFVQVFFTFSEMAFTSVDRIKLKGLVGSGDAHAIKLDNFLKKEGAYLGTTLVGTNIAVVVSSVLATRIFMEFFGSNIAPFLATVVMVPITLIFAEIVPKIIARQSPREFALKVLRPLSGFYGAFLPVIVTVNAIARLLLMPFGKRVSDGDLAFTKKDLKGMLLLGHETGEVEADEVELIHKVLDFGSKKVERIMVPLYRVSSIDSDDTTDNLKALAALTGFSRIPVYRKNKSDIIGIVNIYDVLFTSKEDCGEASVKDFIREPVYVNWKDGLDIALMRLRHKKQPMGIVTDEGDKVVGIITIEDMLEEIVGEIEDTGWRKWV